MPAAVRRGVARALDDASLARYWMAEDGDGQAVASASITTEWSNFYGGHYWWVQSLFVSDAHRGQRPGRPVAGPSGPGSRRRGSARSAPLRARCQRARPPGLRAVWLHGRALRAHEAQAERRRRPVGWSHPHGCDHPRRSLPAHGMGRRHRVVGRHRERTGVGDSRLRALLYHTHLVQHVFLRIWRGEPRDTPFPTFDAPCELMAWARAFHRTRRRSWPPWARMP